MTRLLMVELTRLRWRRAVLLLLAAAVVIPVVIGIGTVWDTRPPTAEDRARVDAMVAEEREQPYVQEELERCIEQPDEYGVDPQEPTPRPSARSSSSPSRSGSPTGAS